MPKQEAVVAITSGYEEMFESLELMWNIVIPAMHDAVEPDAQARRRWNMRSPIWKSPPRGGRNPGPWVCGILTASLTWRKMAWT